MEETSFVPIWYDGSKKDLDLHVQYMKLSNGYCLECQRPISKHHYLCSNCRTHLKMNGLEYKRVGYKEVGLLTINYQQSIHRKLFKCNAPYLYRGLKENRVKTRIKEETILAAVEKIDIYLSNQIEDEKTKGLYLQIRGERNAQRRIMYSLILYCIAYYVLDAKEFKHKSHFQASLVKQLDNEIKRIYIKKYFSQNDFLKGTKLYYRNLSTNKIIFNSILDIIKPILLEIY